ncbi:MAG: ATP-dependent endonuclease, partial [Mameliella sp.]|nr:ATP-dependent endonuclease [Phaeodactylibacter sp.]
ERLLIPEIIRKFDKAFSSPELKLGSKYLTIIEAGGHHAHIFFNLLDFLQLHTLIITDIDTVDSSSKKCLVSNGVRTSNSCINTWFSSPDGTKPTKDELLAKTDEQKVFGFRRLAYQVPHHKDEPCGRSFEDAFMLANSHKFQINGKNSEAREVDAYNKAKKVDKTDFALTHAINDTEWNIPRYIEEGLKWLNTSVLQEDPTVS